MKLSWNCFGTFIENNILVLEENVNRNISKKAKTQKSRTVRCSSSWVQVAGPGYGSPWSNLWSGMKCIFPFKRGSMRDTWPWVLDRWYTVTSFLRKSWNKSKMRKTRDKGDYIFVPSWCSMCSCIACGACGDTQLSLWCSCPNIFLSPTWKTWSSQIWYLSVCNKHLNSVMFMGYSVLHSGARVACVSPRAHRA